MSRYRSGPASPIFTSEEDGTDELAIFGGQTRILVTKTPSRKPSSWDMTSKNTAIGAQFSVEDIHPSLVNYMSGISQTSFCTEFSGDARLAAQDPTISLGQSNRTSDINGRPDFPRLSNLPVLVPPSSTNLHNDPNYIHPFQQLQPEAPPTGAVALDAWGSSNATDLNTMIRDDGIVDEQWTAFLRESGMII